jgi:hypothetical protein
MQLPIRRFRATSASRIISRASHRACGRPGVERLEERLCLSGYLLVDSFDNNTKVPDWRL